MSAALTPGEGLMLSSIRRTCQRLWNNVAISAEQKRLASEYFAKHGDDARKLHALNLRMSELITKATPAHQQPTDLPWLP